MGHRAGQRCLPQEPDRSGPPYERSKALVVSRQSSKINQELLRLELLQRDLLGSQEKTAPSRKRGTSTQTVP